MRLGGIRMAIDIERTMHAERQRQQHRIEMGMRGWWDSMLDNSTILPPALHALEYQQEEGLTAHFCYMVLRPCAINLKHS
jgi:hypothetical protein